MKVPLAAAVVTGLLAAPAPAPAQTPSTVATGTSDLYHVHFTKAAPGQAAALGKTLSTPDPSAPMPDHFVVLRHQEGDDWDYVVIEHLGPKASVSAGPATADPSRDLRAWHTDTYVAGPSWADFSKAMGAAAPNMVYVVGVQRPIPGHRDQLQKSLSAPSASKVETGNVLMQHVEGADWTFLTITRYNSWQDLGTDRAGAAADPSAAGGWADIRTHSGFHRDTIADRVK